jgi:DNA-binding GntR family transcriptional regulator
MDTEAAAEYMVQRILAGAISPGARLTERDIAEAYGCTNAFARDVIHRLQILGAIRFSSRRGASIIGPADVKAEEAADAWNILLRLLETKAGEPFRSPARGREPYGRLLEIRGEIERLGRRASRPRLVELLKRIALQRFIISDAAG